MEEEIKKNPDVEKYQKQIEALREEIKKIIVGQDDVIKKLLLALIIQKHVLLEGVPGLAKSLLVKTMSECIGCNFIRYQFTPDLMPSDIIGTKIYNPHKLDFETREGPILKHSDDKFTNFFLADEINRAPQKVQSALLEAMEEKQITIQGDTKKLDPLFFVVATQNPIESEGVYKLPEAQLDRFLFKILIGHQDIEHEKEIMKRNTMGEPPKVKSVLTKEELIDINDFIYNKIDVKEKIFDYVAKIIDATRPPNKNSLELGKYILFGASPRASLGLILGGKAHALFSGRDYVESDDIKAVAYEVLRHRILLNYEAQIDNVTPEKIIGEILKKLEGTMKW